MKRPKHDEIPVTKLSYNTVYTDFSELDGEWKIIYLNPKCVLVAVNGIPWMLCVTPDFDQNLLISTVGEDLHEVKQLVVQSTFDVDLKKDVELLGIPDWLLAFKNVEILRFERVILKELWLFRNLPLKKLILSKITYEDEAILLNSILDFKNLTELIYDESLADALVSKIKALKPNLKVSVEADK